MALLLNLHQDVRVEFCEFTDVQTRERQSRLASRSADWQRGPQQRMIRGCRNTEVT